MGDTDWHLFWFVPKALRNYLWSDEAVLGACLSNQDRNLVRPPLCCTRAPEAWIAQTRMHMITWSWHHGCTSPKSKSPMFRHLILTETCQMLPASRITFSLVFSHSWHPSATICTTGVVNECVFYCVLLKTNSHFVQMQHFLRADCYSCHWMSLSAVICMCIRQNTVYVCCYLDRNVVYSSYIL